ncbi:aminopeptidase N-like isoform X2 [Nylanderia fulva]|nr:aminopeptidase N-like isoform X2 [Nylanderia fulva]
MKEKLAFVAATHFYIIGTRHIMSTCWDEKYLFLEPTFNISIGCNQCTALSNMPLRNTEKNKYNMLWTHFDTTPAMSPYLATIIVSNYLTRVDNNTQHIQMWCKNESVFYMEFAKNVAEITTLFYKTKWKQGSNSISKVTHVAIPNFPDNGTITFGLVLYNEMDIVYDKNLYPIAHKIEIAQLVGHKVTQQRFYNLNNPFRSSSWFNEVLTTLLTTYALDSIYRDNRATNLFVVQNQHTSFYLDDYDLWNSISQDDSLLKIRESIRAPCILRMIQHAVTKEIFQKGVRSYTNSTHVHRQSFMTFLEEVVAHAKNVDIDISLQTMKYWTLEEHCPLIKVVRNYDNPKSNYRISIQNFDILKIDCVPVTYVIQSLPDFDSSMHRLLCKSKDIELTFTHKERGWFIVNVQQIGYYRVNYDDENWRRISDYLYNDDFTTIHVLNRAQIIDDAFHLMIAGQLEASIFWDIISYLHEEEDYIAWYPMFKALEYIFSAFPVENKTEKFADRIDGIRTILHELLAKIKYEEIDDADELRICLRQEAAKWACFFGDITCMEEANNKLKQHLHDSIKHRLLPWWKTWTYCRGLMTTTRNEITFGIVYTRGFETTDIKFSEYLACIEDTDFIIHYLSYKHVTYTKQQDQFLANTFLHFITKHAKNPIILQYIFDNFNEIKPKNVNIIAAIIIMINNVYSENLAKSIEVHSKSIVEANVIEVNTEDQFKKHRIKEMNDRVIHKIELYSYIIIKVKTIRKKQIEKQRQYFARFFF